MADDESVSVASSSHGPLPPDTTEADLAHELNKLSVNERVAVLEDIHGVASPKQEDPRMVEVHLLMMEDEIQRHLNSRVAQVYQQALEMDPEYTQAKDLRLMFLRTDDFDVPAATQRFLKFFHFKLQLFGKEKLCKEIRLDDLSKDDMVRLQTGAMQELMHCDRSGRAVVVTLPQLRIVGKPKSHMRAFFYFAMSLVKDRPDIQKNGAVLVFYNISQQPRGPPPSRVQKVLKVRQSLPFKYVTHHFCHNPLGMGPLGLLHALWWRVTPSSGRVRTRRHSGSDYEIQRQLRGFGIPMDVFPVNEDGTVTLEYFQEWLRNRRELEQRASQRLAKHTMEEDLGAMRDLSDVAPGDTPVDVGKLSDDYMLSLEVFDGPALDPKLDSAVLDNRKNTILTSKEATIDHTTETTFDSSSNDYPMGRPQGTRSVLPAATTWVQPPFAAQHSSRKNPVSCDTPEQRSTLKLTTPEPKDILLGRGKPIRTHPGNVQFRLLLERHKEEYDCAPKFVKSLLARNLVQVVTSSGSRFLKPSSSRNQWVVADERAAQEKVAQFFRSQRASQKVAPG